jgi:hypothetical protein
MFGAVLYGRAQRACQVEGTSIREASPMFGLDRRTIAETLAFSVPPRFRRGKPRVRPKLDPFTGIVDRIPEEDRAFRSTEIGLT